MHLGGENRKQASKQTLFSSFSLRLIRAIDHVVEHLADGRWLGELQLALDLEKGFSSGSFVFSSCLSFPV